MQEKGFKKTYVTIIMNITKTLTQLYEAILRVAISQILNVLSTQILVLRHTLFLTSFFLPYLSE